MEPPFGIPELPDITITTHSTLVRIEWRHEWDETGPPPGWLKTVTRRGRTYFAYPADEGA